jgi:hypothetical protein
MGQEEEEEEERQKNTATYWCIFQILDFRL